MSIFVPMIFIGHLKRAVLCLQLQNLVKEKSQIPYTKTGVYFGCCLLEITSDREINFKQPNFSS